MLNEVISWKHEEYYDGYGIGSTQQQLNLIFN